MCEPLSIASAVAAAGSVAANAAGTSKARKAASGVYDAESDRQADYTRQAMADVLNTSNNFNREATDKGIDKAETKRVEHLNSAPARVAITSEGTPDIIQAESARASGEATQQARQQNLSAARLGAYGDQVLRNGINLSDLSSRIGSNATKRNISQSAVPLELSAAGEKGQGLRSLGDLLSMASMATGLYGALGPAGAASGAPAGTVTTAGSSHAPNSVLGRLISQNGSYLPIT